LFHFTEQATNDLHGGSTAVGGDLPLRRLETLLAAQVDRESEFGHLLGTRPLQLRKALLLSRQLRRELLQAREPFVENGPSAVIWVEIPFVSGDDVAALACLRVLGDGKHSS